MKLKKYKKYFEKWEYGFLEGLIIGVIGLAILSDYTSPLLLVMLALQVINILLTIISGSRRKASKPGKLSIPSREARPRVSKGFLGCPECGAKPVDRGQMIWIPRHKKGCSQE